MTGGRPTHQTRFGNWGTVWKRFRRWAEKGVFERILEALSGTPDFKYALIDGTIVKEIVVLVDALGNLASFVSLPGQRHDSIGVEPLLHGISFEALIGDKAFDSDWLRAELNQRGALAVIPPNGSRAGTIPYDKDTYKWRHLVENFLQQIKEFRRIATRYDKTNTSFRAAIHLVASFLALK